MPQRRWALVPTVSVRVRARCSLPPSPRRALISARYALFSVGTSRRGIGLPVGSTAVLRYEDFAPPSTLAAFGAIAGFLQLEDTVLRRDVIADDIERTIQAKHAGFRVRCGFSPRSPPFGDVSFLLFCSCRAAQIVPRYQGEWGVGG